MTTLPRRRLRAGWVASLLLLIGLVGASGGAGGRAAGLHVVEGALPTATAFAVPVGSDETTTPRPDARTLLAGPWSPGHPTAFVLASGAVALVLPLLVRWRRPARRAGRADACAGALAARGPPPRPRQFSR
ncbi:hypothetical protein [Frankia sp. QA3]|uniref:hypothetical protein n=1 Tax=Frankia sp. QA3 TaxID=710111 RepID=UPI000269C3D7|nr:hypothetical protein [Frankia sp. QA3]EIV93398.1 hypothetical protein FraQA3DRAFT_3090 [Frankia sp. QA3]